MDQNKEILEVSQVYKIYQGRPVIRNATLKVHAGECVMIRGANGSGKTTLLRLLSGMMLPTTGSVQLSKNLTVQFVPPGCAVGVEMSALRFLVLMMEVDGVSFRKTKDFCKGVFAHYRISGLEKVAVSRLSEGALRTLLLAQALLKPCGLLILDEPFMGMDQDVRRIFYSEIAQLKQNDTAILFTSLPHEGGEDEKERSEFVDRIWQIDHGEVREADHEGFAAI